MPPTPTPAVTDARPDLAGLVALPRDELSRRLGLDDVQLARWMYQAALEGVVEAQTLLGQMLLDGHGVSAHPGAARHWFARAAAAGHAPAANMLGRCLELGWGGARDLPAAAARYRAAAGAGLDWGQYNLANMLLRGRGVVRDVVEAHRLYAAAAAQGHAKSMNLLGRFLEEGWCGPANPTAAAVWYLRAAKGGDFRGKYNLALVLVQAGRLAEAEPWLAAAGEEGSADFCRAASEALLARPEPALRRVGARMCARCHELEGAPVPDRQMAPASRRRGDEPGRRGVRGLEFLKALLPWRPFMRPMAPDGPATVRRNASASRTASTRDENDRGSECLIAPARPAVAEHRSR